MGETPAAKKHRPFKRCAQVVGRTASKAWDDSIFGKSATAAFWQTLSLPPLLLGLLGSLGYVGGWFGPNTVEIIQSKIITFSHTVFSENVVDQIIQPTVGDVLGRGRPEIISVGFLLSLWADRRRYRRSSIRSSRPTASRTPGTRCGSACSRCCSTSGSSSSRSSRCRWSRWARRSSAACCRNRGTRSGRRWWMRSTTPRWACC